MTTKLINSFLEFLKTLSGFVSGLWGGVYSVVVARGVATTG
jgi:hypothetical protein